MEPIVEALRDKAAGKVEAILEAAEKADEAIEIEETVVELIVEAILIVAEGVEAVLEAAGEIFRIKAAARHTIVFRPGNY